MRSSRPHLTFEMTNRQTTPPPTPQASNPPAAVVDGHYHHHHQDSRHHSHHEERDYDEEWRPRRRKNKRKEIKVLQMIPIVQPMISSHSPSTHSISTQPVNQAQQPQLLSYQALEQTSQSPVLVIPSFGQRDGTTSRILIQPLTVPATASFAGVTDTSASPPLSQASGSAIMIMTSASSPSASYHELRGLHDDGSGGGSADRKKRKRKSKKKVIVFSIKGGEAQHQRQGISGRHHKSCTPFDETCHREDDKTATREADQEDDAGDVGEGQHFLSQGNVVVPEKEIAVAEKDGVSLSSGSLSTTLSPTDAGNNTRAETTAVTNSMGSDQSPSTTTVKSLGEVTSIPSQTEGSMFQAKNGTVRV